MYRVFKLHLKFWQSALSFLSWLVMPTRHTSLIVIYNTRFTWGGIFSKWFVFFYRPFQNYAATQDKSHGVKVAMNCRLSNTIPAFWVFIQKNCLQINLNQSVITNESFITDCIETKIFVWLTAVHCNFHTVNFVSGWLRSFENASYFVLFWNIFPKTSVQLNVLLLITWYKSYLWVTRSQ